MNNVDDVYIGMFNDIDLSNDIINSTQISVINGNQLVINNNWVTNADIIWLQYSKLTNFLGWTNNLILGNGALSNSVLTNYYVLYFNGTSLVWALLNSNNLASNAGVLLSQLNLGSSVNQIVLSNSTLLALPTITNSVLFYNGTNLGYQLITDANVSATASINLSKLSWGGAATRIQLASGGWTNTPSTTNAVLYYTGSALAFQLITTSNVWATAGILLSQLNLGSSVNQIVLSNSTLLALPTISNSVLFYNGTNLGYQLITTSNVWATAGILLSQLNLGSSVNQLVLSNSTLQSAPSTANSVFQWSGGSLNYSLIVDANISGSASIQTSKINFSATVAQIWLGNGSTLGIPGTTNWVLFWNGTSLGYQLIVDANVWSSAAIAQSKIWFSGYNTSLMFGDGSNLANGSANTVLITTGLSAPQWAYLPLNWIWILSASTGNVLTYNGTAVVWSSPASTSNLPYTTLNSTPNYDYIISTNQTAYLRLTNTSNQSLYWYLYGSNSSSSGGFYLNLGNSTNKSMQIYYTPVWTTQHYGQGNLYMDGTSFMNFSGNNASTTSPYIQIGENTTYGGVRLQSYTSTLSPLTNYEYITYYYLQNYWVSVAQITKPGAWNTVMLGNMTVVSAPGSGSGYNSYVFGYYGSSNYWYSTDIMTFINAWANSINQSR